VFAIIAAILFGVKTVLDIVYPAGLTEVLLDLGLLAVALHFSLIGERSPWRQLA
jgi:hypothetical protein